MHYENERLVASAARFITEISFHVLSQKDLHYSTQDEYLLSFLGVNSIQLKPIISYIVSAVPYRLYLEHYEDIKNNLCVNVIHQTVMLLLNTTVNSEQFRYHLDNARNKIMLNLIKKISIEAK